MTDSLTLLNAEVLTSLYGGVPRLDGFRLRSINLNWRGPTVTLRIDLPDFPENVPGEWEGSDVDTVQCHLQFLAVADFSLSTWEPPVPRVSFRVTSLADGARVRAEAVASGLRLGFTSSRSALVGHVSAFGTQPDGSDAGPHLFTKRMDGMRYTSLPEPSEKTFYERL
ncbi:Imm50 family immunity protein [Streptomyces sp. NPDC053493]|uniref:Imm50 family immunity protein n=1 Tax=Streptomyces sp. NPDC053493 TaxID=3365705 RepID=UPI0037D61B43